MNYRKCVIMCIIMLFFTSFFHAQVSVSPDDDFYSDATGWVLKGYVDSLPLIKPYPLNVIRSVLDAVVENGTEIDRRRAEFYIEKYFSKHFTASSRSAVDMRLKYIDSDDDEKNGTFETDALFSEKIYLSGGRQFFPLFGAGYNTGFIVRNNTVGPELIIPRFSAGTDSSELDVISVHTSKADFIIDPNLIATFGTEKLYLTLGLNKAGYGLFYDDGLILNPSAYQTLNTSFNYSGAHFSYAQQFGMMGAADYSGDDRYAAGKFYSFHALEIPVPKIHLSFGLYESVVFAKPFMPAYIMPVPYFIIANVAGFNENVLSGFKIEWNPLPCFALSADLLLDDFDVKDALKLHLNDASIRAGFKTGFVYSPLDSLCESIIVSYTLVTPYTYTKYNTVDDEYNYLDYTNCGRYFGTAVLPNSDHVSMTIRFKPWPNFRIGSTSSFTRHANAYESFSDEDVLSLSGQYKADGSINMDTNDIGSATDTTDFLKQDHIMYIMHASVFGEYEFVLKKFGRLTVSAEYTFEYIKNDGVDNAIFSGSYDTVEAVQADRKRWKDALSDSFNHYFTVGIKYSY